MMNDVYEFKNLFFKYYDQLSINSIYGTPSLIKKLKPGLIKEIANKKSLKFIGFGGEGYSWDELQNLSNEINQKVDFHNYYGPTGELVCAHALLLTRLKLKISLEFIQNIHLARH